LNIIFNCQQLDVVVVDCNQITIGGFPCMSVQRI